MLRGPHELDLADQRRWLRGADTGADRTGGEYERAGGEYDGEDERAGGEYVGGEYDRDGGE